MPCQGYLPPRDNLPCEVMGHDTRCVREPRDEFGDALCDREHVPAPAGEGEEGQGADARHAAGEAKTGQAPPGAATHPAQALRGTRASYRRASMSAATSSEAMSA